MSLSPSIVLGTIGILLVYFSRKSTSVPLPPGPRGLPIIGNVAYFPKSQVWKKFSELGEKYGGIVYLNVFGKSIIVLNDPKYATEMLDKKSKIYSDRPNLVMAGELVGWNQGPALMPFSPTWSEHRRNLAQFMGTRGKVDAFEDVLQEETNEFLKSVAKKPTEWVKHTKRFAGGIVLTLSYGYKSKENDDELVKIVNEAMDQFSKITSTGAFLVDVFPSLRYVPSCFPGASWKRKLPKYRSTMNEMLERPYQWTKQKMAEDTLEKSCFVSQAHEKQTYDPQAEQILKWSAASIYGGGADTTVAGIECFVLAMTLHPHEQIRAQHEIDRIIGRDRLPTLSDRSQLPYFEALFTEVLRRYTFGPLGLPHVVREDDNHDGYFIPKGSVIITNVWQFFRNPNTYPDPDWLSPDRFLGDNKQKDPRDYLFGFGRRTCPGIHLADASMWLLCVSLIAAFDIQRVDKDQMGYPHIARFTDETISHP